MLGRQRRPPGRPLAFHARTMACQPPSSPGARAPAALALLALVQVALGDRLLLALLGYDGPGDQVHERACPDAEDRERRKYQADDVGIDAEVVTDPGADTGDH